VAMTTSACTSSSAHPARCVMCAPRTCYRPPFWQILTVHFTVTRLRGLLCCTAKLCTRIGRDVLLPASCFCSIKCSYGSHVFLCLEHHNNLPANYMRRLQADVDVEELRKVFPYGEATFEARACSGLNLQAVHRLCMPVLAEDFCCRQTQWVQCCPSPLP